MANKRARTHPRPLVLQPECSLPSTSGFQPNKIRSLTMKSWLLFKNNNKKRPSTSFTCPLRPGAILLCRCIENNCEKSHSPRPLAPLHRCSMEEGNGVCPFLCAGHLQGKQLAVRAREAVLAPAIPRRPIRSIAAPLWAQVNLPLPSGPCSTEFSSGIQAGQTITGNSLFLNFISMPRENREA